MLVVGGWFIHSSHGCWLWVAGLLPSLMDAGRGCTGLLTFPMDAGFPTLANPPPLRRAFVPP